MTLRSPLGRCQAAPEASQDDLRRMGRNAWHRPLESEEDRWACIRLGDVVAWDVREIIVGELARQYGKRGK